MAYVLIPLPQEVPHFTQQATLDGVVYTLNFFWNSRESSWYFSISDVDQTPIIMSRKMVADWPLLQRSRHASKPPGELYVLDQSGAGIDPDLEDIGERVLLVYADESEVS